VILFFKGHMADVRNQPKEEAYRLTSQIKKSVVSIPLNIDKGYSRKTTKDYTRKQALESLNPLLQLNWRRTLFYCLGQTFLNALAGKKQYGHFSGGSFPL